MCGAADEERRNPCVRFQSPVSLTGSHIRFCLYNLGLRALWPHVGRVRVPTTGLVGGAGPSTFFILHSAFFLLPSPRGLARRARTRYVLHMSTQELLLEEIKRQPEPVLLEVWHYLRFLTRQREEEAWADVLPSRQVEQEVLDQLDSK